MIDPATATMIVGGLGYLAQQDTNAANVGASQQQMDFQERMSNTAYQRQVKDMEAAGLNPMLAYVKGGGASSPAGSMATYQNPVSAGAQAATSAQIPSTIRNIQQQTKQTSAQTDYLTGAQTELTNQQIDNLKTDNDKAKQIIINLKQEYQNLFKQNLNLTEVGNQLRESVSLMKAQISNFNELTSSNAWQAEINKFESQLRGMESKAAQEAGNFGREYNQYRPFLEFLKSFIRPR
jgi:hypothetical protein